MKKLFTIAFLTVALCSNMRAQAPGSARAELSAVPLWPQNGDTSQLPQGQHVYYDPHAGEYVVYWAPDPAEATQAQPILLRLGTHSRVDPKVASTVAPTGDGRYHYTYKVESGPRSRQPIGKISILDYSDGSPQASASKWSSNIQPHNERDLGTPAVSASLIEWTPSAAAPSIAPGAAMEGFAIDSHSLPGFVPMALRGDSNSTEYTPAAVASLPEEVRDQLASVTPTAWGPRTELVIGPRFAKGTSQSDIAQNFDIGIQVLVRHRLLDANSTFVQNALSALDAQLHSNGEMQLGPTSLGFTKDATTELEKDIANALLITFAN